LNDSLKSNIDFVDDLLGSGNDQEDLQLRQYLPDSGVVGHSSKIGELDANDDDDEYELASEKKNAR